MKLHERSSVSQKVWSMMAPSVANELGYSIKQGNPTRMKIAWQTLQTMQTDTSIQVEGQMEEDMGISDAEENGR